MTELFAAVLLASALTLLWKTGPITILAGDNLPPTLKEWLNFIPVSVMAALVGPDIFFYNGQFDFSFSNLFLIVSVPTFFIAWKTANYFITIAIGVALIIIARYFGFA